jgi:hypothetical protein
MHVFGMCAPHTHTHTHTHIHTHTHTHTHTHKHKHKHTHTLTSDTRQPTDMKRSSRSLLIREARNSQNCSAKGRLLRSGHSVRFSLGNLSFPSPQTPSLSFSSLYLSHTLLAHDLSPSPDRITIFPLALDVLPLFPLTLFLGIERASQADSFQQYHASTRALAS